MIKPPVADYDPGMPALEASCNNHSAQVLQFESNKAIPTVIAMVILSIGFGVAAFVFSMGAKESATAAELRLRLELQRDIANIKAQNAADLAVLRAQVSEEERRIDRETRLQRVETDEIRAAVLAHGIRIHAETDKP